MTELRNLMAIMLLAIINITSGYSQDTPFELVDNFFKTYEEKGPSPAIDYFYGTNVWMQKAQDAIVNLKNQMEGLTVDYIGAYYGYELITQKKISDSFILLSYLVKYDRQPLRFTFQFYKPDKTWRAHSFQYDGELGTELEESAKIYYLDFRQ